MSSHRAASRQNAPACGRMKMRPRSSACMISAASMVSRNLACNSRMPAAKGHHAAGSRWKEEGGWTPEAPSAIPYDTGWAVPHAMTKEDIKRCFREFAEAAKRVDRIGYDVIELHGAHGYLAHQFMSPLSN